MNLREELYLSGAGLTVQIVYAKKGGRRVPVLDEARRTKAAILTLLLSGKSPRETARALDLPVRTVCVLGVAAFRGGKLGKNPL